MLVFLSKVESRLHQLRDGDRTGRSAHLPNHCNPAFESRAIKHGVDSTSSTPSKVSMVMAKKVRKSSTRVKGSSGISAADPKMDKSSPTGDADVSNLLKMNFMSSLSTCFMLVDHIHQALDTFTNNMKLVCCCPIFCSAKRVGEEDVAEEAVAEDDGAKEDVADEMVVDVAEQAGGAVEGVADQVDAKEAAD
ncbi:unnamed protein product [Prunus armeniaca]